MDETVRILIGTIVLVLGIPLGNYLAKITDEELVQGRTFFKILVYTGLVGGIIGLIIGSDVMLFGLFFVAIVTSRSLKKNVN